MAYVQSAFPLIFTLYSLIIIIQIKLLNIFTQAAERCIITLSIIINTHEVFQNNNIYICRINLVIH